MRTTSARVALVGDVKQLGSVSAGRAFGQLQDAGMKTHKLAEIVRQSNPDTRRAVEHLLAGDAETAIDEAAKVPEVATITTPAPVRTVEMAIGVPFIRQKP